MSQPHNSIPPIPAADLRRIFDGRIANDNDIEQQLADEATKLAGEVVWIVFGVIAGLVAVLLIAGGVL